MTSWRWVPKGTVFGIHAKSLSAYGGVDGVRDERLLESALARPRDLAKGNSQLNGMREKGSAAVTPFFEGKRR